MILITELDNFENLPYTFEYLTITSFVGSNAGLYTYSYMPLPLRSVGTISEILKIKPQHRISQNSQS